MPDMVPQLTPEDQARIQQIFQSLPKTGDPRSTLGRFSQALHHAGIQIPQGYMPSLNGDGTLTKDPGFWKSLAEGALITGGLAFGGPLLMGAAGGGGSAAGVAPSIMGAPAGSIAGLGGIGSGTAAATTAGVGGTAAAAPSILGRATSIAGKLSPILSGAAEGRAKSQQANETQQYLDAEFRLKEPDARLKTSMDASKIAHQTPVTVDWGGPGSGLQGQPVKFNGGYNNPDLVDPKTRQLANQTIDQELQKSLQGGEPLTKPGHSSLLDNLLGYGSTAAGIAGAFKPKAY